MDSKLMLRKSLGVFLLLVTAGIASCQAFFFSWTADADARPASGVIYLEGQSVRRN